MSISQNGRFEFKSLRADWYHSNATLPRVARACLAGRKSIVFTGFPRHWIPLFEWFGLPWRHTSEPTEYIPVFSDLSETAIVAIVGRAKKQQSLRILVESASMLDPVLVDFLYNLDHTSTTKSLAMAGEIREALTDNNSAKRRPLILTGWQSYGRPSVRQLETDIMEVKPRSKIAVVLPCSVKRPYDKSLKHRRLYQLLKRAGYEIEKLHRIVFTSLGVLPEELWQTPQVMKYDARVPDLYRILRLTRAYFAKANYEIVLNCQNFGPFSDILNIAEREGTIRRIVKVKTGERSHFYIR